MRDNNLKVIFRGVRGSYPVPGSKTLKYGGNTTCFQLQAADKNIIIDAGTGICTLGDELVKKDKNYKINLFFTHIHWDHIQGFPFFKPLYYKKNTVNIYALKSVIKNLKKILNEPFFPVSLNDLGANINFIELENFNEYSLTDNLIIKTYPGKHTTESLIYRIDYYNKSCSILLDYEHPDNPDSNLENFIYKSNLLIYDAHYLDDEYLGLNGFSSKKNWGHSTWQQGIKLARKTKIDKLVFSHHAPERSDQEIIEMEKTLTEKSPNSFAAREGEEIIL